MSIARRVKDITAAHLYERLESSADPVKLIDQYLHGQYEMIREAEQLRNQCLQHAQSLRQQMLQAESARDKRESQASIALRAGEEHLARLALQEKLLHEEKAQQYRELFEQSTQSTVEMEEQLNEMKAEYQEVYEKRQFYIARLETVRLQQKMNERMHTNGSGGSVPRMFQRLEDQISGLELETGSLRELRRKGQETLYQAGSLLQSTLERELALLKDKLNQEGGNIR